MDSEKEPVPGPRPPAGRNNASINGNGNGNGHGSSSLPMPTYAVAGPMPMMGPPTITAQESSGPTLKEYMSLLRRRRALVLYAFTFVTVLGTIWTLLQPPVYRAAGKLLVEGQGATLSAVDATNPLSGLFALSQKQDTDTQVQALQSKPLIEAAQKKVGKGSPFSLKVEKVGQTNVIAISAEASSPQVAAEAPVALMTAYLELDRKDSLNELSQARDFVEKQRNAASRNLIASENQLRQFKQRTKLTELEKNRDTQIGRVDTLQARLGDLSAKVKVDAAQIQALQTQLQAEPEAIATNVESDNTVRAAIREELRKLQVERIGQAQRFGPKNRSLISVDAQILKLQEQLNQQPAMLTTRSSTPNPIRTDLRTKLAGLLSDAVAASTERQQVVGALADAKRDLSNYPAFEVTLARLMREHDIAGDNEKMLSAKAVDLALREKAYRPSARIMEGTDVPTVPVRPRKAQNILVFALFGIFVGVCLGLVQEYLDDRINSLEESDRVLRLSSLGMIPTMTEGDVRVLPVAQHANPALESYRLLRTNIQFASIDEPVKTLLVTSASPGEGKSTTAVNLAFAMALDGKRVILVDTDLRRPSLHKRLKLPSQPGLTDVLLDDARLEDVLTPQSEVPNLSVITSGALPPNPSELLNSRKFHTLCTQLAEWADIVIFDSPPVLVAADGAILASQMDSTILVIEAGGTRKSSARAAMTTLEQARARVLGVVHNKLKNHLREGYDYYAYSTYRYQYTALPEGEGSNDNSRNGMRTRRSGLNGKNLAGLTSSKTVTRPETERPESDERDA